MGDADGEVMMQLSAQEIEAWMDEGVELLDEGFENLLALVTNLNERTKVILQELKILESFRKVFIALNMFIVPVVIAIMLCYGTKESVSSDSHGFEAEFQRLVMLLMLLSSSVGLPFYIIAVWQSYKITVNINEEPENQSLANDSQDSSPLFDDSLLANESSMERLNEFASLLNDRMLQRMRADLQRRRSTENDASEQRTLPGIEDSSEIEMVSAVTGSNNSVESSEEIQDYYLDVAEEKAKATEFPVLYQFQVLMTEQSPDLAVRFEATNKGERRETTKSEEMVVLNKPQDGAPYSAVQ